MTTVAVIAGGLSPERDVSLRSGAAVADALAQAGYTVRIFDPAHDTIADLDAPDVAFPVLHGAGGEDGTIQKLLEAKGIPYVGSDIASSELCFDKARFRALAGQHDIPLAEGALVDAMNIWHHPLSQKPFVLKPFDGGSSIDTFIIRDITQAPRHTIDAAFGRHSQLLLEELIDGTEITIGILGSRALPVIEIVPPVSSEFDYENKYNGATQELCPPQHIDKSLQRQAQKLALKVHTLCGCRDLSRTDMIVSPTQGLVVLEINTLPGMTGQSLLPKAAAVAGTTMPALCDQLAQMALARSTSA